MTHESRPLAGAVGRVLIAVILGLLVALAATRALDMVRFVREHPDTWPAMDLEIMRELGRRWLETGTMYLPYQLEGPFSSAVQLPLANTPALYPPVAGPIFAVLWLIPWPVCLVLWYAIPAAILAYAVWRWRPAMWAWAGMVLMCCFTMTWLTFTSGGTAMWASALVAAGFLWGWPSALILVKPILLPFALVGARRRSWWLVAGAVAVVTLLGPWQDYIAVARNVSDVSYTFLTIPLLLLPVWAWLGSRVRSPRSTPGTASALTQPASRSS